METIVGNSQVVLEVLRAACFLCGIIKPRIRDPDGAVTSSTAQLVGYTENVAAAADEPVVSSDAPTHRHSAIAGWRHHDHRRRIATGAKLLVLTEFYACQTDGGQKHHSCTNSNSRCPTLAPKVTSGKYHSVENACSNKNFYSLRLKMLLFYRAAYICVNAITAEAYISTARRRGLTVCKCIHILDHEFFISLSFVAPSRLLSCSGAAITHEST